MTETQSVKKRVDYNLWTKEESGVLLKLMVDATNRGLCNNRGVFTKQIVEEQILPCLNSRFGCNKNYNNYQSRLKWFKNRWLSYSTLLKFDPGFRYDSTSKRFTSPNEVWGEYLMAHPKDGKLRNKVLDDYEDLEIAIGNGVVARNTEGRILEAGEGRYTCIDDLNYDIDNEGFIPKYIDSTSMGSLEVFKVPKKKLLTKRGRKEYEGGSNLNKNTLLRDILEKVTKLTTTFEGIYDLLQKRENERTYTTWDAIKEVPNLEEDVRLEAFNMLNTKTKKDGFLKMNPEERTKWILNMMSKK